MEKSNNEAPMESAREFWIVILISFAIYMALSILVPYFLIVSLTLSTTIIWWWSVTHWNPDIDKQHSN